jgi:hypothetical protein
VHVGATASNHTSLLFLSIFAFTDTSCFSIRLARREKGQGRFSQKKEEAQNAMRERSSVYKEKEKVSLLLFPVLTSVTFS